MNIETGAENHEREKFKLKKIPEIIKLSVYMLIKKLWRVQTIFLILSFIATILLLLTFFRYDARLHKLIHHKDFDKMLVMECNLLITKLVSVKKSTFVNSCVEKTTDLL